MKKFKYIKQQATVLILKLDTFELLMISVLTSICFLLEINLLAYLIMCDKPAY